MVWNLTYFFYILIPSWSGPRPGPPHVRGPRGRGGTAEGPGPPRAPWSGCSVVQHPMPDSMFAKAWATSINLCACELICNPSYWHKGHRKTLSAIVCCVWFNDAKLLILQSTFASYQSENHPTLSNKTWKIYGNAENSSTPEIVEIYENPTCLRKP